MNDKNKTYEFSTHISNDYIINLQNKKHFFHDFIYSLFESRLKTFKIDFDKYLINDFIFFSIN